MLQPGWQTAKPLLTTRMLLTRGSWLLGGGRATGDHARRRHLQATRPPRLGCPAVAPWVPRLLSGRFKPRSTASERRAAPAERRQLGTAPPARPIRGMARRRAPAPKIRRRWPLFSGLAPSPVAASRLRWRRCRSSTRLATGPGREPRAAATTISGPGSHRPRSRREPSPWRRPLTRRSRPERGPVSGSPQRRCVSPPRPRDSRPATQRCRSARRAARAAARARPREPASPAPRPSRAASSRPRDHHPRGPAPTARGPGARAARRAHRHSGRRRAGRGAEPPARHRATRLIGRARERLCRRHGDSGRRRHPAAAGPAPALPQRTRPALPLRQGPPGPCAPHAAPAP